MLFFSLTAGRVTSISESFSAGCVCRADKDFDAESIATQATELTGDLYIPVTQPAGCWPKTDVVKAPKVGDLVSSAFNGDSYPEGEIVKVSPNLRIVTTSTGARFFRKDQTDCWKKTGGTWNMVDGHRNERNPCF